MCAAIGVGSAPKQQQPQAAATMALPGLNNGGPTGGDAVSGGASKAAVIPGTTDLAGMMARKKLTVMRTGILSTVRTGTGGVGDAPTLAAPAAGGGKALLGQ